MITSLIFICLIFGVIIGICIVCLVRPAKLQDTWLEGYRACLHDHPEDPSPPAITRRHS